MMENNKVWYSKKWKIPKEKSKWSFMRGGPEWPKELTIPDLRHTTIDDLNLYMDCRFGRPTWKRYDKGSCWKVTTPDKEIILIVNPIGQIMIPGLNPSKLPNSMRREYFGFGIKEKNNIFSKENIERINKNCKIAMEDLLRPIKAHGYIINAAGKVLIKQNKQKERNRI